MSGEIISIETAKKIESLEKENKKMAKIIFKFDAEINKQWKIITETYKLLKNNPNGIKEALEILEHSVNQNQR